MKLNTNRRKFLQNALATLGSLSLPSVFNELSGEEIFKFNRNAGSIPAGETASDEDLWQYVRQSFTHSPNIMNLNNGGVSPQPKVVQDAFDRYNKLSNEGPAYYMWQVVGKGRESVRENLAKLAGCSADEAAIVRNTSEALETVIFGLDLKKGDEVVLTRQDYPNMVNAWKQREKRDGIVLKWVSIPQPIEDDDLVVKLYTGQFTSRTKALEVMHMINWNGQILPVRKIADEAHKLGIEVIADGAHTFAHIQYNIPDLGCDYFGTSLHKWLYSPFGTGMLYVKKDKIKNIWPLTAPENPESDDIRKFEAMGTRSFPAEVAIGTAIEFHGMIGSARKEARLRYLKEYWMKGLENISGIRFYTSRKPQFACGLGCFSVDGIQPVEIQTKLFENYNIFTTSVKIENVDGLRITPNVYTSTDDLDKFVDAVHKIVKAR